MQNVNCNLLQNYHQIEESKCVRCEQVAKRDEKGVIMNNLMHKNLLFEIHPPPGLLPYKV